MGFSKVSLAGYVGLGFGALILHYMAVIHPYLWTVLLSEDGLIEGVQVGFFLLSGVVMAVMAFVSCNIWRRLLFYFLSLTMVVIVGEEISWGQRIFGFETPDWLKTKNLQKETNFHNLFEDGLQSVKWILSYAGATIIFSARFSNKDKLLGIPLPSVPLAFGLLIVMSYRDWLLPNTLVLPGVLPDVLTKVSIKYSLLVFLLVYVSFRFLREGGRGDSKKLVFVAVSTIALILSYEYAAYVRVHTGHVTGVLRNNLEINAIERRFHEIDEYILSLICFVYLVELLITRLAATESIGSTIIDKEARGWLPVCSVMTVCSLGLVPVGYFYAANVKDVEVDRFYSEVASSGPVARSVFDVYAMKDQLIYHKQPCAPTDIESRFFLHVIPDDEAEIPENRRPLGFDNFDFQINVTIDDHCLRSVDLPDYRITSIRTGQFTDSGEVWRVEILFPP